MNKKIYSIKNLILAKDRRESLLLSTRMQRHFPSGLNQALSHQVKL